MNLTKDLLQQFADAYAKDKNNGVIAAAISNVGVKEASRNRLAANNHSFSFSDEIDHKNITNQKKSGRCWMFAALNMARPKIMEDLKLEEFEFSQTYLYFFDNMEKTNVFLDKIMATKNLDINSREVIRALEFQTSDGGYFEWFKTLADKYGLVPKSVMGESFSSQNSADMFDRIHEVIKKYAMDIRRTADADCEAIKVECLSKVYNILAKCLGEPVQKFDFEYVDKDKKYHLDRDLTPQLFYKKYLGDFYEGMVRLINDPRERNPYGRVYINPSTKNVLESDGLAGLNVPIDAMKAAMIRSIKDKRTAWFACDVGKMSDRQAGILDGSIFNFEQTLVPVGEFTKADRLDSRQAVANHAMNITGVNLRDEKPVMWKVENSWGDEPGKKGVFSMSDTWFSEYVFEMIVNKKYVDAEYLKGLEQAPIIYDDFDAFVELINW